MQLVPSLKAIAGEFDAIIFDQWGVLHNGSLAYPGSISAVNTLRQTGIPLAVLSNSGKRSLPNRQRITAMGFPAEAFQVVMTSGEALWLDMNAGRFDKIRRVYPICGASRDAPIWLEGLTGLQLTAHLSEADAILLMGLPDDPTLHPSLELALENGLKRGLPLFCSNPDKASPRLGGALVRSPGALAEAYSQQGGEVFLYGKPHSAVFESLQRELNINNPARLVMIGDSIEHDIAGAAAAGWQSVFITGGLHAAEFRMVENTHHVISSLCDAHHCPLPDFYMEFVS